MRMSTYVVGIRDYKEALDKGEKFLEIYRLCKDLKIAAPIEVCEFVATYEGDEVDLSSISEEWSDEDDSSIGIEIKVSDIPKNVKIIRFVNRY